MLFVDTKLFRLKTGQAMLVLTVEKRLELKDAFSFSRLTAPAPSRMEPKRRLVRRLTNYKKSKQRASNARTYGGNMFYKHSKYAFFPISLPSRIFYAALWCFLTSFPPSWFLSTMPSTSSLSASLRTPFFQNLPPPQVFTH